MEKDKESMALLENKRQEFRYNQVVRAVNKEKNLRERELSHERNHFKTRLHNLIEKRKELNLDPTKTKQLEVFLSPRGRNKNRLASPERKASPGMVQKLDVIGDAGNNVFLTNAGRSAKHEIVADCYGGTDLKNASLGQNIVDQNGTDLREVTPAFAADGRVYQAKQVQKKVSHEQKTEIKIESSSQADGRLRKSNALRRSVSDLQMKLGHVQQWLHVLETGNETKALTKRHSVSR